MDSDDDYQSFSPPKEPSPQAHHRRFKRLKKSDSKSSKDPFPDPFDDPLLFPQVDFARLEALENDSEIPDVEYSNSIEETIMSQESISQGIDDEDATEDVDTVEFPTEQEVKTTTKRVLEFDADVTGGFDENGRVVGGESDGIELEKNEEMIEEEDPFDEKGDKKMKKKKNRKEMKSDSGDESKTKMRSNKRREEKVSKFLLSIYYS